LLLTRNTGQELDLLFRFNAFGNFMRFAAADGSLIRKV
jgi:hypothetical protein